MEASRTRAGKAGREGIGLTLVRSLVEQEKGRMEICTKAGTSITCSFPIR
jgi:two-component sensor histidine kinase